MSSLGVDLSVFSEENGERSIACSRHRRRRPLSGFFFMNIQNHSRIWMHCFRTLNLLMREQPFIYAFCCWMLHYFLTMHQDLLKVEQVSEEAESFRASLDKYMSRHQKRIQEAQDRAELLGRASGDSHVLRIFDDETQARESVRRSSRLLEESFATGVSILSKYSEQRDHLKRAQRKALDVLNTLGLSNSLLRLIERRNRVDKWIKYAGMALTIVVLIVFWRWTR